MSGISSEVQQDRQTGREEDEDSRTTCGSSSDGSVCPVNGPATTADNLRARFTTLAEEVPALRAIGCLCLLGWTPNQIKTARDRWGDDAIVAAIRYTLSQTPPPNNPGGYLRECLRNGWYAPVGRTRTRGR